MKNIVKYQRNKIKTGFDMTNYFRNNGRRTHFNDNESQILRLSIKKGIVDVRPFSEHAYSVGISYSQHIERKKEQNHIIKV